ncbi:MAG: holo-ACP synthase [Solirubrobacterales bacterium]
MDSIGIDLVDIERIERALARRPRLAERLFTDGERAYAERRPRPGRHLAARFAAKEAVIKALHADPAPAPAEIEVVRGDRAPRICFLGAAARLVEAAGITVSVSLTHTDHTAGAVAAVHRAARG